LGASDRRSRDGEAAPAILGLFDAKACPVLNSSETSPKRSFPQNALHQFAPQRHFSLQPDVQDDPCIHARIPEADGLLGECRERRRAYRNIFRATTITVGAVRRAAAMSSRNGSRDHATKAAFSVAVCREPGVPHPVRRGTQFFADQIRLNEFTRAVIPRAPWRRNLPGDRFRGERVSGAPAPCRC